MLARSLSVCMAILILIGFMGGEGFSAQTASASQNLNRPDPVQPAGAPQAQPGAAGNAAVPPKMRSVPSTQVSPSPASASEAMKVPSSFSLQRQSTISGGHVSLNFDDADVFSVIQTIFGDVLKFNYVIDPRVKGRVNFRSVAPVPRENILPLMEVILRLNGIGVVEDSGLYRIVPISDLSKEPSAVHIGRLSNQIAATGKALLQVIPIRHLQSSDVIKMMTPFLSANAVVVDVPKSNQIIVVDTDASVKRIVQLIEIFDNDSLKKRAEIFVHPVQNGKAREVAGILQQIFLGAKGPVEKASEKPGAQPGPVIPGIVTIPGSAASGQTSLLSDLTRIFPDDIANSIIVLATPEDDAIIRDTIIKIDTVPRQVIIEGMIAQVTLTDNLSLGMAWSLKANVLNLDTRINLNPTSLNIDPSKPAGSGLQVIGIDSGGSVRALITALATESKAKLLAAPHILVSDNREARIQVGQQVPIITAETFGAVGITPQRTIQYKDIGIILKVKPRVNQGGLVNLEMSQEVSTFSTIELYANEKQIILNKTEANTNLVVQDGQTIIIGGLIREDKSKSRTGIPFLSRIPLIGWLFGNTSDEDTRTEIIILLTPRVIKNLKEATALTSEYMDDLTRNSKGRIKKEELLKGKGPDGKKESQ